jgi:hypothetical protein
MFSRAVSTGEENSGHRGREAAHEVTVAYTTDYAPALRPTGPLSTSARIGDGLNPLTMR